MASVKDTLRYYLFKYPNIFPEPIFALEHMFFINGNGHYWSNGELVCDPISNLSDFDPESIDYNYKESDYDDYAKESLKDLIEERKLKDLAQSCRRIFIRDNIYQVLEYPCVEYFGKLNIEKIIKDHYIPNIFNVPDDIKPAWAKVALNFIELIRPKLYEANYFIDEDKMKEFTLKLNISHKKLFEIVHNCSYDEFKQAWQKVINEILG